MTYDELRAWRKKWKLTIEEAAVLMGCSYRTYATWQHRGVPERIVTFCTLFDHTSNDVQMAMLRRAWATSEKVEAA